MRMDKMKNVRMVNGRQSAVSEEDSAQRERHLKDMRDRIVSAKRAGREEQASKAASESASAAAAASAAGGGRAAQARTGGGAGATRGVWAPLSNIFPNTVCCAGRKFLWSQCRAASLGCVLKRSEALDSLPKGFTSGG